MARPRKEGLDYFPLHVHFDEKVRALEMIHKNDGLVWIIKFWQNAYSTNTGEVDLSGIFGVIHAENCRITTGKQSDIIDTCLKLGLITLISESRYTSSGIQKRLDLIVKDREIERKRKLLGSFPAENKPLMPQSKVKERKVKESKINSVTSHESFLEALKNTYNYINLDDEFKKMDGWLLANPHRKKTRRFIINWLNRVEKPLKTNEGVSNGIRIPKPL